MHCVHMWMITLGPNYEGNGYIDRVMEAFSVM